MKRYLYKCVLFLAVSNITGLALELFRRNKTSSIAAGSGQKLLNMAIIPRLTFVAWLVLWLGPINIAKGQQTSVDAQTAAHLQSQLDILVSAYNLKGLSASVIIPGKGTWNGVSGISHAGVPIDTAMVFRLGSITKNFTAAGILLLQEDGLLSLSDPLHEYLPAYPNIDSTITIQQLLQHTSGIYSYTSNADFWNVVFSNPWQAMTPHYVLNNFVNAPAFPPGSTHYYSNTNYLLLGLIIEQVSGQSYASFIRQRLLDPLQLSSFYMAELEPGTGFMPHNWVVANPWDPGVDIYTRPMTAIVASSVADNALAGTAYDLARWGKLLFSGQVLQPASLQQMTQFFPFSGGNISGYGLGLMRHAMGSAQAFGHGGQIEGFSTSFMYSPADSIVVSVLANKETIGDNLAWFMLSAARQKMLASTTNEAGDFTDTLTCFPNPAQHSGTIQYSISQLQQVEISLQNSLGQTVQTLFSQPQQPGRHSLQVDLTTLPAGIYFCTLQTSGSKLVQRWAISR